MQLNAVLVFLDNSAQLVKLNMRTIRHMNYCIALTNCLVLCLSIGYSKTSKQAFG